MAGYDTVISMEPEKLIDYMFDTFVEDVPVSIVSIEDMKKASELLLKLSSSYSYLCALLSYAKVKCREAKRNLSKAEYEDMVDKKDIISNITEAVKHQYAAVSRSVTIHIENNNELKMNMR